MFPTTVLVCGCTGYMTSHLVKQLLEKGYRVIGSVRSINKGEAFSKRFNCTNFQYVVVPDINRVGSFNEVFKSYQDIEVVFYSVSSKALVHSPEELQLIKRTVNILKSIQVYGLNVKRVLLTTNCMSHYGNKGNSDVFLPQSDTNSPSIAATQVLSNYIGNDHKQYHRVSSRIEKKSHNFMKSNRPRFVLTCLAPCAYVGPQAFEDIQEHAPSIISFLKLSTANNSGKLESVPPCAVDVRDVAKALILAAENSATVFSALSLSSGKLSLSLLANIINKRFPQLNIPDSVKFAVDKKAGGKTPEMDCKNTLELLGMDLIPLEESIVDTVSQIID